MSTRMKALLRNSWERGRPGRKKAYGTRAHPSVPFVLRTPEVGLTLKGRCKLFSCVIGRRDI
jgi:hypothetical protein